MMKLKKRVKSNLIGCMAVLVAIGLGVYAYTFPRGDEMANEEVGNLVEEIPEEENTTPEEEQSNEVTQPSVEEKPKEEKPREETTPKEENKPKEETPEVGIPVDRVETTANGFRLEVKDGLTYVEGILIANKSYPLTKVYVPTETHKDAHGVTNTCNECIKEVAWDAFQTMKADASLVGINLYISSGYRSYSKQEELYNRYVQRDGVKAADTYSSRPGHSDHQTGYAFDINTINDSFHDTKEAKWVNDNCYLYGFVVRFPKNGQSYTGYKYESWHLRYVGVELASKLYNDGDWISLEEYFGIPSVYAE